MSVGCSCAYPDTNRVNPTFKPKQKKLDITKSYRLYSEYYTISGMGSAGNKCGYKVPVAFSPDGDAIKFASVYCGRVECPECYQMWLRDKTHDYAVRLLYAMRKYDMVTIGYIDSPDSAKSGIKKHDDINGKLFRRSYDISKRDKLAGGVSVFHPFRLRGMIKKQLGKMGCADKGSGGLWKGVRNDVLGLNNFYKYVRLSPHVHSLAIMDKANYIKFVGHNMNYFRQYKTKDNAIKEYNMREIVAYLRYVFTHAGISRVKKTQSVRLWGVLRGLGFDKYQDDELYWECIKEVDKIMHTYTLDNGKVVWADYKDDDKKEISECDMIEWINIWELPNYINNNQDFISKLSLSQLDYYYKIVDKLHDNGFYDIIDIPCPDDIIIYGDSPNVDNDDNIDIINMD